MRTIFEELKDIDVRKVFLEKKEMSANIKESEFEELSEYILSDDLIDDLEKAARCEYVIDPPEMRKIKKFHSTRRRVFYIYRGHQKMFLQYLSFAVLSRYDHLYTSSVYSYRKHYGVADCFRLIRQNDQYRRHYAFKTDIHAYSENLDQEIATHIIHKYFTDDPALLFFLDQLLHIDKYYVQERKYIIRRRRWQSRYTSEKELAGIIGIEYHEPKLVETKRVLVDGMPLGGVFTNLYLNEVDKQMRTLCFKYMRFGDDICGLTDTYYQAQNCLDTLKGELSKLKVAPNDDKTGIYHPGQTFDYLGLKFSEDGTDIADVSVGKIKQRFKRRRNKWLKIARLKLASNHDVMKMFIRQINLYFFGMKNEDNELNWVRWSFGNLTKIDGLKEIDKYLQDCLRVVGSGKYTNARYRITYKQLKKEGYISLVHAYYHGYTPILREEYMADFVDEYYKNYKEKRRARWEKRRKKFEESKTSE